MFKKLYASSLLVSFLSNCSAWVAEISQKIGLYRIFFIASFLEQKKSEGFFASIFKRFKTRKLSVSLKHRFSLLVEGSFFVDLYRKRIDRLLSATTRSFAVFLLSFGMYSTATYAIKIYALGDKSVPYSEIVIVFLTLFAALPLFLFKTNIAQNITHSFFTCHIASLLTLDLAPLTNRTRVEKHETSAFVLGTVAGLCSFLFLPSQIYFFLLSTVFAAVVMYSPEGGMVAALCLIPLARTQAIFFILLLSLFSYLVKCLRGKRNLSFRAVDLAVLAVYLFNLALGGANNIDNSVYTYIIYFLLTNSVRNGKIFNNCLTATGIGITLNMTAAAMGRIVSIYRPDLVDLARLFNRATFFEGEFFLAMATVFLLAQLINSQKRSAKIVYLIAFASTLFNAVTMQALGVWLLVCMAVALYFLVKNGRIFNVLFFAALLSPIGYYGAKYVMIYNDIQPFVLAKPNMYGALKNSGGIALVVVFAFALYMLASQGYWRLTDRAQRAERPSAAFLMAMLLFFALTGLIANPLGELRNSLYFSLFSGLLAATNGTVKPIKQTEEY